MKKAKFVEEFERRTGRTFQKLWRVGYSWALQLHVRIKDCADPVVTPYVGGRRTDNLYSRKNLEAAIAAVGEKP